MKITLCGSAKFEKEFHEWSKKLILAGHTVYSLACFPSIEGGKDWYKEEEKMMLDLVHLSKIEESDTIVVLNAGDYIGDSTKREVAWARIREKDVYWIEAQSQFSREWEYDASDLLKH